MNSGHELFNGGWAAFCPRSQRDTGVRYADKDDRRTAWRDRATGFCQDCGAVVWVGMVGTTREVDR